MRMPRLHEPTAGTRTANRRNTSSRPQLYPLADTPTGVAIIIADKSVVMPLEKHVTWRSRKISDTGAYQV